MAVVKALLFGACALLVAMVASPVEAGRGRFGGGILVRLLRNQAVQLESAIEDAGCEASEFELDDDLNVLSQLQALQQRIQDLQAELLTCLTSPAGNGEVTSAPDGNTSAPDTEDAGDATSAPDTEEAEEDTSAPDTEEAEEATSAPDTEEAEEATSAPEIET